MLERSFIHVPGIGPHRERELWKRGFTDWQSFRDRYPPGPLRERILERLSVDRAARELPRREAWRLYPEFAGRTAFLDIETDGIREDCTVTCIGLSDRTTARAFLAGNDLDAFPDALEKYDVLVTYNGAQFDIPVLRRAFPDAGVERKLHIDLRFPFHRLGLRGGLKRIERECGIFRAGGLSGVDGATAILLWRRAEWGHPRALETLAAYCLEDTVNLLPLMVAAYNRMIETLPIDVPAVPEPLPPSIPYRADPELLDELLRVPAW